ncbi:hypothetical protein MJO28_009624 [Puccinia striiformis f. sp. tritici]|uniref:Uncharacterized protein n=1 Tax=Puccinia striiformis f. sp. tritici TaxID=168172 RepID=A0ACC0E7M7_9BASI|nr:hypothetical protein Pst134EA_017515 [Puccinia striiformis f. sp. tritici]KAH9461206.1 hypothetical protein Pst134EA_017515 [Puccinia striiformis f. sp. tritici]KAI7947716.1 hypothetical protein MJO28_009624 [Puccinia striiformis f. sp. tritici]
MDGFGLPVQFGKIQVKADISNKISETKRNVQGGLTSGQPVVNEKKQSTKLVANQEASVAGPSNLAPHSESEKEEDDEEEDGRTIQLPTTHEVLLKDHSKTVSALSLDPSGARLVSGSYDYACKLWDFGGMNSSFKPFRSWEPRQSHQVHQAIWSNTGDSFLVITAANQPQIYDRDGAQIAEYMKGDMYIRDMRHCAGHIAELTSGAWHPKDAKTFITSSADSTIRIWDVENKRKSKGVIVLKSKERGTRTKITACTYSSDGKSIAAAGLDGTLNIWATNSNFTRPNAAVENGHVKNTETSSLQFASDNRTIVSRGGDDTVKLWDVRALKSPLAVRSGMTTLNPETSVTFSPDNQYILTGVSANPSEGLGGRVVLLDKLNLEIFRTIAISPANVVRVLWHPKINQIVTGSSDGSINVLYSPSLSTRGATLSLSRTARARGPGEDDDAAVDRPIITPHALAMFRNDEPVVAGGRGGKRRRERERQDPVKTLKPMPPLTGPGRGGRVGASATQHVVQGLVKDSIRHEDPREALLKFAQEHEGERPKYTAAWEETMPEPVFDQTLLEEEAQQEAEKEAAAEERKRVKRERPTRLT